MPMLTTAEFAAQFAADNDARLLPSSGGETDAARQHLLQSLRIATSSGYLNVETDPFGFYLPVPHDAELIAFRGAVRRGIVIRDAEQTWIGYSIAGNGTYGAVWQATGADAALLALLERTPAFA